MENQIQFEDVVTALKTTERNRELFSDFLNHFLSEHQVAILREERTKKRGKRKLRRRKKKRRLKKEFSRGSFLKIITPVLIGGAGLGVIALLRKIINQSEGEDVTVDSAGVDYNRTVAHDTEVVDITVREFPTLKFKEGVRLNGIDQDLAGLLYLFNKHKIPVRVTSARRTSGEVGNSGDRSPHTKGRAIDVVPISGGDGAAFSQLREAIRNNKEVVSYMIERNINILDETNDNILARTGGTGRHFHIERSLTATSQTIESTKRFWKGITGQGREKFGTVAEDSRTIWEQEGTEAPIRGGNSVSTPYDSKIKIKTQDYTSSQTQESQQSAEVEVQSSLPTSSQTQESQQSAEVEVSTATSVGAESQERPASIISFVLETFGAKPPEDSKPETRTTKTKEVTPQMFPQNQDTRQYIPKEQRQRLTSGTDQLTYPSVKTKKRKSFKFLEDLNAGLGFLLSKQPQKSEKSEKTTTYTELTLTDHKSPYNRL
jgi:hypothetical protein